MDSEAKVSGLAKKKKNFLGSFQLSESMTQDFLSTGRNSFQIFLVLRASA
jgi:hypothetical protein